MTVTNTLVTVQRTDPLYQAVLADAKFHEQLLVFDRDLSATARAAGCHLCGGTLHSAQFARKPRGCRAGLGQEYGQRFSFCCAADGCRKRTTPPSLRFLCRRSPLYTPRIPLFHRRQVDGARPSSTRSSATWPPRA